LLRNCSFGTVSLANPDPVAHARQAAALNEPDPAAFYPGEERGYTEFLRLACPCLRRCDAPFATLQRIGKTIQVQPSPGSSCNMNLDAFERIDARAADTGAGIIHATSRTFADCLQSIRSLRSG
jgi:hypothetical protein